MRNGQIRNKYCEERRSILPQFCVLDKFSQAKMVQSITIYSRGSFSSMIEIKIQSFTNKVSHTKARRKFGENHKKRDISKTTRICAVILGG